MFHLIPDAKAITRSANGLYRQVDLYKYKERIFIKYGTGFAWVLKVGSKIETSIPHVGVDELILPFEERYNNLGYLVTAEYNGGK